MKQVVCFGDSHTRGLVGPNFLELLETRLGTQDFCFINEGRNNDHTLNLVRRADDIIARQPDVIIVMIGTNDILSTLSWRIATFNRVRKRLPQRPTIESAALNVTRLVRRLKAETQAQVALASIPVLGEDLDSAPNQRVHEYTRRLKSIVEREGVDYLPVNERMEAYLCAQNRQSGRAYHGSITLMFELMAARAFKKEDFNEFSRRQGFTLLTDGVHVNHSGASLIAEVFAEYLSGMKTFDKDELVETR